MVVKVQAADMSERRSAEASDASALNRQQRIARYKEERRRQLASQFAKQEDSSASTSSSGGGVVIRTTRTSRLRVAATSASDGQKSSSGRVDTPRRDPVARDYVGGNRLQVTTPATSDASKEKSPVSDVSSSTGPKRERDKSSKRKSNLNRSLNAEEVPALDISEENGVRRRRRVAATPTLSPLTPSPATVKTPSTRSTPSPRSSVTSPRPVTASRHPSSRSDRGSTPESDTPKSRIPRKISSSSSPNFKDSPSRPRPSSSRSGIPQLCDKSPDSVFSPRNEPFGNHLTNGTSDSATMFTNGDCSVVASPSVHHSLTVETLQEKHTWNGNLSAREEPPGHDLDLPELVVGLPLFSRPSSILKKKSIDESSPVISSMVQNTSTKPVSILKRKTSQEEGPSTVVSQPVTFSPSVVDPVSGRRQGILKKHRSLDEAEVVRRRSCSPDVDAAEFKPILKNQRRSSLEELVRRAQSPEPQSILKRKSSREENLEHSSGSEPQGILKRKSSSGSSSAPVHVTIAESVILAVGGAQETVYDEDHVRPILKKKTSSSEEPSLDSLSSCSETPISILKKKSSSETDDTDEKHRKRPILKSRKDSGGSNCAPTSQGFTYQSNLEASHDDDVEEIFTECEAEVSRILDLSAQERDDNFLAADRFANITFRTPKSPFDSEYSSKRKSFDGARMRSKDQDGATPRRPLSVAERVMNMEHFLALESTDVHRRYEATSPTGAVPKRPRERERFRTQPVTLQELSTTQSWQRYPDGNHPESRKSDESSSINPENAPQPEMSETVGVRLSRSESVSARASLFAQLEKKATEEVKPKRLLKGSASRRAQDTSRFSTHPVTSDEVEEAKRQNENKSNIENQENEDEDQNDPSKLSLAERVSLFNQKMVTDRLAPARPRSGSRFKTQPITTEEVVTAQKMAPAISRAASGILVAGILKNLAEKTGAPGPKEEPDDSSGEEESEDSEPSSPQTKRGILKSPSLSLPRKESVNKEPKSVLKKENEKDKKDLSSSETEIHSILKVSKSKETGSDDSSATQSENSESDLEDDTPNANSDLVSLLHKVEAQARSSQKISDDRFANVTIRKKPNLSLNISNKKNEDSDKVMNLKNLDQGKENRRVRRRLDVSDNSEGDTSSSGGREVKRIIGNEAVARRRQAAIAKQAAERSKLSGQPQPLSKSKSQSAVQENNGRNMNGEVAIRCSGVEAAGPLRRCLTQPMGPRDDVDEPISKGASIAQRLAALQKSGQSDWRKRISRLNPEEDLPTPKNISDAAEVLRQQLAAAPKLPQEETPASAALAERLGRLETASQGWKKRVAQSDAVQFSVAGKMALAPTAIPVTPLQSPVAERKKKTPKPNRFRSKEGNLGKEAQSMPTSPEPESPLTPGGFKRSISAPGGDDDSSLSPAEGDDVFGPMVSVPRTFDDDFSTFFSSASNLTTRIEQFEIRDEDLDELKTETNQLLVQRKTVKVQNRRASSNPIKALAARSDLRTEYVEVKSGVAQRELRRINVEKLSKNSTLAIEALAGLASKEDFTAINLRKAAESTAHLSPMLPYNELMLIQVKGRRHVQTRLVLPHYSSINQGDSYVLVTPTEVYHWIGEFSNVIERSRGAEITQNITQTRDLGSTASQAITLHGAQKSANHTKFWKLIGASDSLAITYTGSEAGHPDEDELYESAVTDTNMVYELQDDELIPSSNCWGAIPKIEILDPSKILVFDFGSELYVWMGKNAGLDRRRMALKLGQELWRSGFDYSECDICPLNQALFLGNKNCEDNDEKKATSRPEWALLAKVTQHMETVLFREKFLDWPDFSRVIRTKGADDKEKQVDGSLEIKPCDAQEMVDWTSSEADLQLEGSHLGRGRKYYDPETHRHYEIKTLGVRMWHVQEFESSELDEEHLGQFHTDDSYVIRWLYSITVTGRELNGQPSRHSMIGRDRCAYFIWQGSGATVNDQGAAALLTVELDKERGPQIRVAQGSEPPAFKQLFNGGMSIHKGKLGSRNKRRSSWRLYLCRGEVPEEALLVEVTCSVRQLRSRASFILLNTKTGCLFIWHGAKSLPHTRKTAITAAENLQEKFPAAAGLDEIDELTVEEVTEGKEPKAFFDGLGGNNRGLYISLANTPGTLDWTPTMYHLSSVLGVFKATPIVPPSSHSELTSPFPFLQEDLYSARQPALFLLDAEKDIWLWQGWWGEETRRTGGGDEEENGGWGEVRWQAERRAAMSTAIEYWKLRHGEKSPPKAHLVWAGLEPLEFTNLFPQWTDRDDIAEVNIKDGRKPGEVLSVQSELARLTRSIYPPAQLLQRPLPDGVDPTRLENYLAPHHFQEMLGMSKEEFAELPTWKQTKLKKVVGLF